MFYKILLSVFMVAFIAACSTTPKGTADSSGSGSSGTSSIDPSSGDAAILEDLINTPLGGPSSASASASIKPGSQEDLIVNVGDRVFFAYDSAELDADAQELLLYQATWFKEHDIQSITIEGHCDERGTREYNLALGERRANAVKDYLMTYGISGNRISVISYGKERPVNSGSDPLAWSQNRRSVTVKAN